MTMVAVVRKVTSMKAMAAVVAVGAGERVNVSRVCAEVGVSRKTFYKWVARYRAEGLDGLEERSRRPNRTPGQTAAHTEELVVRLRKELADAGLDHGATTIQWHLGLRKAELEGRRVPAVATIHRILVRRGLVTPSPSKRPKSSWCRFEAPAPNEWWQIDAMGWVIATGAVEVFNVIDDHSASPDTPVDHRSVGRRWSVGCGDVPAPNTRMGASATRRVRPYARAPCVYWSPAGPVSSDRISA